ncbi:MAG: TetR/AcrR family transcriptional regulator C-terminal domain-containing protein [Lachnospira eligens]
MNREIYMSQLTRKAIMKCTLELAEKKSLKKITVKDIADECGITRSTFYYHFSDIYDVLDGVVQAKIDEFNEEYNGEMDKVLMRFIEYSIIHRKVWANLFDARGREWLEKYVKTRIHYLALLQIRKMSEGYILSIKDVEIICSFYEEAIFGLLIRWIIKEEKTKTVDEIKDTVERIEKLFEGQLDLIISNMKK